MLEGSSGSSSSSGSGSKQSIVSFFSFLGVRKEEERGIMFVWFTLCYIWITISIPPSHPLPAFVVAICDILAPVVVSFFVYLFFDSLHAKRGHGCGCGWCRC